MTGHLVSARVYSERECRDSLEIEQGRMSNVNF